MARARPAAGDCRPPTARPVGVPERLEGGVALGARLDRRQAGALGAVLHALGDQRQDLGHLRVQLRHRTLPFCRARVRLALDAAPARFHHKGDDCRVPEGAHHDQQPCASGGPAALRHERPARAARGARDVLVGGVARAGRSPSATRSRRRRRRWCPPPGARRRSSPARCG